MARARYQLNETAGRERLGRGASQQRSRPTRAREASYQIYIYIVTVASRMAVAPRGHRHRWRAIITFISRPTAATANEGTRRQAGEIIIVLKASRMAVVPQGH